MSNPVLTNRGTGANFLAKPGIAPNKPFIFGADPIAQKAAEAALTPPFRWQTKEWLGQNISGRILIQPPFASVAVAAGPSGQVDRYVLRPVGADGFDSTIIVTPSRPYIGAIPEGVIEVQKIGSSLGTKSNCRGDLVFYPSLENAVLPQGELAPQKFRGQLATISTTPRYLPFTYDDFGRRTEETGSAAVYVPCFGQKKCRLAFNLVVGTAPFDTVLTLRGLTHVFTHDLATTITPGTDAVEVIWSSAYNADTQEIIEKDISQYDWLYLEVTGTGTLVGEQLDCTLDTWARE